MLLAITREVSPLIGRCELTHLPRVPIDVTVAKAQHQQYEDCLARLGCEVRRLPAQPEWPDSVFIEDTCIVLYELAVVTRPGAVSRRGETAAVAQAVRPYRNLQFIEAPGTIDGGDVLVLGKKVFVGVSRRTNMAAIDQLRSIVSSFGYEVTAVPITNCLHLQSAATRVGANTILANRRWVDPAIFGQVTMIEVDPSEPFAANALLIGNTIVYATSYPATRARLELHGIHVASVDIAELAKAEGAVTCCSLVFPI